MSGSHLKPPALPGDIYSGKSGVPGPRGDYLAITSTPTCERDFLAQSAGSDWAQSYVASREALYHTYHNETNGINCSINMHHGPFRIAILENLSSEADRCRSWQPRDTFSRWTDGLSNCIVIGEKHIPIGRLNKCVFNSTTTMFPPDTTAEMSKANNSYDCGILCVDNDFHGRSNYSRAARTSTDSAGHPTHAYTYIARPTDHETVRAANVHFGSWHPDLCLFLYGDGAVLPMNITASIRIWGNLATVDSGVTVNFTP